MKAFALDRIILVMFLNPALSIDGKNIGTPLQNKYSYLISGGLSGISYNNGTRMQLGAITPSCHLFYKGKFSLHAEYYRFDYYYGGGETSKKNSSQYGYTYRVHTNSTKLAGGLLFQKKFLVINPYASINYRFSKSGHQFHWPKENNPRIELFNASSPFQSAGLGLGTSISIVILKHINLGLDCSYSRYFDKRKIWARTNSYTLETVDVSESWTAYKPLNNVVALQAMLGFLF